MTTAVTEKNTISALTHEGDVRTMWDPRIKVERDNAEKQFAKFQKQGYRAHKVNEDGTPGQIITRFDPQAGKIIMTPPMAGG